MKAKDKPKLTRAVVARLAGVGPETLRFCDRTGSRIHCIMADGWRCISNRDIKRRAPPDRIAVFVRSARSNAYEHRP